MILNLEILMQEIGRLCTVSVNASHLCRRDEHVFRTLQGVEFPNSHAVQQVEFGASTADEILETTGLKFTPDGAANQAAVARNVDATVRLHGPERRQLLHRSQAHTCQTCQTRPLGRVNEI